MPEIPPHKTAEGQRVLQARDPRFSSVQRRILILVDGRRDLAILQALLPDDDDIKHELKVLASAGLIDWVAHSQLVAAQRVTKELVLPENWPMIRAWMTDQASACLGVLAMSLIAKFDKVSDTVSMRRAISQWHFALHGSRAGHAVADAGLKRVNEMLAN